MVFCGIQPADAQKKLTGDATYYGNKFHGRRTSDGSTYHRDSLTCAHRTLPFGTILRVRNTKNGREVMVKVTDRGPFRRGGIVDLSYAAAKEIDMLAAGVVPVEVEPVYNTSSLAPSKSNHSFTLPELQLLDPSTGKYRNMSEWMERGKVERERAQVADNQRKRAAVLGTASSQKLAWKSREGQSSSQAENM